MSQKIAILEGSPSTISILVELGHNRIAFINNKPMRGRGKIGLNARFQNAIVDYSKKIGIEITEVLASNEASSWA